MTAFTVWLQAISSGAFLLFLLLRTHWFRNPFGRVLAAMTTCLFALTLDLALTSTNEGLGATPLPVLLARLGFGACMIYGIIIIETKNTSL